MTGLMRWILPGSVLAMFIGCSLSASETSPAPPRESVTSAADTTVLLWTDLTQGYLLNCADQCGHPNCDCLRDDECPSGVDVDQPCTTPGAQCDLIDNVDYSSIRCMSRTIPTPPPSVWQNRSGSVESCADICGTTSCACVHNRCAAGVAPDAACSPVGASCNLMEGAFYEHLNCVAN